MAVGVLELWWLIWLVWGVSVWRGKLVRSRGLWCELEVLTTTQRNDWRGFRSRAREIFLVCAWSYQFTSRGLMFLLGFTLVRMCVRFRLRTLFACLCIRCF